MSSHLTIIQGPALAKATQGAAAPVQGKSTDTADPLAAFAAILDALLGNSQAVNANPTGADGKGDGQQATLTPTASPATGTTPLTSSHGTHKAGAAEGDKDKDDDDQDGDPLAQFIDILTQIDTAMQAGKTPDPALLQKLDQSVAKISNLLGIDPDAPLAPGAVAPASAQPSVLDQLADKADGIARAIDSTLTDKLAGIDPNAGKTLAALTHRLDAVAQKFDRGDLSTDTLARLGFTKELQLANSDTAAKLDKLVSGKAALGNIVTKTPELGTAKLLAATDEVKGKGNVDTTAAKGETDDSKDADKAHKTHKGDDGKTEKVASTDGGKAEAKPQPAAQADSDTGPDTVAQPQAPVTTRIEAAGPVRNVAIAYQANAQVNVPHLAFEMARQFEGGKSRFQIRLDPPELGRIDVHMHVDNNGNVNARMTVDKAETLDLLQRDQPSLEKALAQAGLDGSKTNLEFSLRQTPFAGQGNQQQAGSQQQQFGREADANSVTDAADAAAPTLYRGTVSAGGLNLFV